MVASDNALKSITLTQPRSLPLRTFEYDRSIPAPADPRQRLNSLPAPDPVNPFLHATTCKVCGGGSIAFDRVDFNKYCSVENYHEFGMTGIDVDYVRCMKCGFIFTEFFDDWSTADFGRFIYNDHYIKMDGEYADIRPSRVAEDFARRLSGAEGARILDYGSGAGVFVQRMRDRGFRFIEGYDPFSSPQRPQGRFDIITCFEVIEHATDPVATLDDMLGLLQPDGCILLSQTLQPDDILAIRGSWWYLAPRNGHVCMFTEEAFEILGRRNGLYFHRGDTVYGLAGRTPSRFAQIALGSIGPSFATLRLHAPSALADVPITFPRPHTVVWHRTETASARQFRWTGSTRMEWRATWPEVARLRVHIPMLREARVGFASECRLVLDEVEQPVKLVRGEMTAEFDVFGRTGGTIELRTPAAVVGSREGAGRAIGIAVATARDPIWPEEAESAA